MKEDLVIDGKRYLSSRRASEISKYTQDYIGQLCRREKLLSKKVSKTWFVEEGSLRSYIDKENSRSKAKDQVSEKIASPPFLNIKNEELGDVIPKPKKRREKILAEEKFSKPETAQNLRSRSSFWSNTRKVMVATFVLSILIGSILFFGGNQRLVNVSDEFGDLSSASFAESLYNETARFFENLTIAIFELFDDADRFVRRDSGQTDSYSEDEFGKTDRGVVVKHQKSQDAEDGEFKEMVNRLFSDKVIVNEDDDRSGIINPVFQNGTGDDYLYVMVPVDEADDEDESSQEGSN